MTVLFVSTHYYLEPHEEIVHLRIPEKLRLAIAAKLQHGVKNNQILDDIGNSVTDNGLQREHLTTKHDTQYYETI